MKYHLAYLIGILITSPALGQYVDLSSVKGGQKLDSTIIFGPTGQPVIKDAYTYDVDGELQCSYWIFWEGDGEWLVQTRTDHYYTDNGYRDRDVCLAFKPADVNNPITHWDTLSITFFTYDGNGNIIRTLCQALDNFLHQYKNNMEFDYAYDEYNRITERINLNWDDATSSWINYEKIIYIYTQTGRDSAKITCYYSHELEDWYASRKVVHHYSKDGNDTLLSEYNVYSDPPELLNNTVQNFDEKGFITSAEVFKYQSGSWIHDHKHEYTSDAFGNIIIDTHFRYWSTEEETYQESSSIKSYYSGPVVPVKNINKSDLKVYPNPAESYINFNLPFDLADYSIQLFNLQGLKVADQMLRNNILSVDFLPRGTYLYKLSNGKKSFSGKIILQ